MRHSDLHSRTFVLCLICWWHCTISHYRNVWKNIHQEVVKESHFIKRSYWVYEKKTYFDKKGAFWIQSGKWDTLLVRGDHNSGREGTDLFVKFLDKVSSSLSNNICVFCSSMYSQQRNRSSETCSVDLKINWNLGYIHRQKVTKVFPLLKITYYFLCSLLFHQQNHTL